MNIPTSEEIRVIIREEILDLFSAYQIQSKPKVDEDETGGVDFASKITGKAIPTIYSLAAARIIPHYKQGKQLIFKKSELEAWKFSNKRRTVAEIQTQL